MRGGAREKGVLRAEIPPNGAQSKKIKKLHESPNQWGGTLAKKRGGGSKKRFILARDDHAGGVHTSSGETLIRIR